jgi:hypothetical protein
MKPIFRHIPTYLIAITGALALLALQARLDPPPADPCKTAALPRPSNGLLAVSHRLSCERVPPEIKA